MLSFDLTLIAQDDSPIDRQQVWRLLEEIPHIRPERGDPGKLLYYNRATTVHFSITLGEALYPEPRREDLLDGEVPDHVDVLSESSSSSRTSRLDEEELGAEEEEQDEEDEDDDEDEDDEEHEAEIELPPMSFHVPLFRPTFFLVEALELLRSIEKVPGLQLVTIAGPAPDGRPPPDGPPAPSSRAEVLESWQELHRQAFADAPDKDRLQVWTEERCAAFYNYNSHLPELQEQFAQEGLEVIPIQPARHDDRTKTLCVWRCDRPALLPRTDLVLLQRPRERRVFRRSKLEEFVVPGETLWTILEPFSETRYEPAPMLIVRNADNPPGRMLSDLEALRGESTENAKRTEIAGVVDFDVS